MTSLGIVCIGSASYSSVMSAPRLTSMDSPPSIWTSAACWALIWLPLTVAVNASPLPASITLPDTVTKSPGVFSAGLCSTTFCTDVPRPTVSSEPLTVTLTRLVHQKMPKPSRSTSTTAPMMSGRGPSPRRGG